MPSKLSIITLAAAAVAITFACARPSDREHKSRLTQLLGICITTLHLAVRRLLRLRDLADRRCFLIGVATGGAFAVLCNLVPFFQTFGAYRTDGFEVIGFPLVFHTAGGFSYFTRFHWLAFFGDFLFAAIVALIGGYAAVGIQTLFSRKDGKPR